jgi:hypothetical protein
MLTGGSRKLPHALFCPSLRLKTFHPRDGATDLTRVETFPGAACLRRFSAIHAFEAKSRGRLLRAKAAPSRPRPPGMDVPVFARFAVCF